MTMFDLGKRVALVTGAGRGMGVGIATALAAQGAAVAVNDLHLERAEETAGAIRARGGKTIAVAFDVTDNAAVTAGVARIEQALGPIDVLVNNAGVPEGMGVASFREMDPSEWRKYVDLNLYGVLNCTRSVLDGMCARGFGRVITISSGAGQTGLALGVSLYGAGKGGAIAFMRHLAMEVARNGVTANTIALGLMANTAGSAETSALARTVPVGRLGTPEDVGGAVVYLASNEAGWVTGQTIGLNGGSLTS
jgi:NAD(P)-dependent dehydrogenase (short-subunit alcohol dehydrogenase family)